MNELFTTMAVSFDLGLKKDSELVIRILMYLSVLISTIGTKFPVLNFLVNSYLLEPCGISLHHDCSALEIPGFKAVEARSCCCVRIELLLKCAHLVNHPALELSVMMYGLFQDSFFKSRLSELFFKNMHFMIGPGHYSNIFLIYNQFFNKTQVRLFLSEPVAERHLAIFSRLEETIMLETDVQKREEACERLMSMVN